MQNKYISDSHTPEFYPLHLSELEIQEYLFDKASDANCKVKLGLVPAFSAVVFKKSDFQSCLDKKPVERAVFWHDCRKDSNGLLYSTLRAHLTNLSGGDLCPPPIIGVSETILFNQQFGTSVKVEMAPSIPPFTWEWQNDEPGSNEEIDAWLDKLRRRVSPQNGVDFIIRARLTKVEIERWLKTDAASKDDFIAFFPAVIHCEILPGNKEPSGYYCTLICCTLTPDKKLSTTQGTSFYVLSDAWRPNWPKGVVPQPLPC